MAKTKEQRRPDMPKADFVTSLVLLAFSAAVIMLSLRLPRLEHRDINEWTIPGLVPALIGGVIGLMAIVLLIRALRWGGHRLGLSPKRLREFADMAELRRAVATIAICLFYALVLVGLVPYVVGTFLFVFLFILLFTYQREIPIRQQGKTILVAAVEALIVSTAVASLFRYVFLVRLP